MDVQRGLVERIEALRQRLHGLTDGPPTPDPTAQRLHQLLDQFLQVQNQNEHLEERLAAMLRGELGEPALERLPAQLAYRTRRLLLRARNLIDQLRDLATQLPADPATEEIGASYRQTLSMAELALRSVQSFPDGTAAQLNLCDGFEAMLDRIEERSREVVAWVSLHKKEAERLQIVGHWLQSLVQGRPILVRTLTDVAEQIQQEAREGLPPRFVPVMSGADGYGAQPELWAAAHGMNVAQIVARLASGHDLGASTPLDAIVAALVHDAGMASLPVSLLAQGSVLNDDQRRQVETHVGMAVEGLRRVMPQETWLINGVLAHHERLDGTGYPGGRKVAEIPRLARLLGLLDTYVALQCARPYRDARSPKAALTETLLEAERGRLDPELAELLLQLSFYPIGSVVELSDGRVGIVVATQHARQELTAPAKPIVRIVTNADGAPMALPVHLNLAQCAGLHVVRSLTANEAKKQLSSRSLCLLAAA